MARPSHAAFALLLFACAPPEPAQSRTALGERLVLADPLPDVIGPVAIVLDVREDGARIEGHLRVPPPNADPAREVLLDPSMSAIAPELAGDVVIDARFAGSSILFVDPDHVLRVRDADGTTREIDTRVHAPISVAGDSVAYARGEIPELEIARADVPTGVVTSVTQDMAPAWSPALSEDASAIVFVSGTDGSPRLYRADDGGLRAVPLTDRTPSSPLAPRWIGGVLVFEDESGTAAVELETGRPANVPNGGVR